MAWIYIYIYIFVGISFMSKRDINTRIYLIIICLEEVTKNVYIIENSSQLQYIKDRDHILLSFFSSNQTISLINSKRP